MSVFLGPKQLFPSKQQIAHVSVSTGWFEWWERGRGTIGTHQQPLGVQTLFLNRGRSTEKWDLNHSRKYVASYPKNQRRTVPSRLPSPRVQFVPTGFFAEVPSNSTGSLSGRWRDPKASFGSRPSLTSETVNTGINSSRRRTKHHPPILHLAAVLALCRGRSLLTRSVSGSGTSNSSPPMSAPAKPWEVGAQERRRRARSLLIQAALWAPSMAERNINPRGPCRVSRSQRDNARSSAWADCFRTAALTNAARSAALPTRDCRRHRDGYRAQWCECLPNLSTIRFTPIPPSHVKTLPQPYFSQNLPTFFFSLAAWQYPGTSALMAGHRRCTSHARAAYRSATRFRAEVQREGEQ